MRLRLVGVPGVVYDNDMMMTDRVSAVDGMCWLDGLHRSSEVERVVTGFPVTRVAAVGPTDHRVETVVRVGGVLDQPHGAVRVQHAVRSLDHVALPRFPLALHVVRFRIVHRVIELVSLWRLSTGFEKKKRSVPPGSIPRGGGATKIHGRVCDNGRFVTKPYCRRLCFYTKQHCRDNRMNSFWRVSSEILLPMAN